MHTELPDIELTASAVHEAWIAKKRAAGISSRKAEDGEELMVPYAELSEGQKEMDRSLVRTVYEAIAKLAVRV